MKRPQGDNYLVFGAEGQIGREFARRFAGTLAVCKAKDAADITDHKLIKKLIRAARPAAVVNVAGINNRLVPDSERDRMWAVNTEAVDNLVRCCALYGVPFVHVSTDEVYGGDTRRTQPYKEIDVTCAQSFYGMTKVAAEHAILNVAQLMMPEVATTDFQHIVVRTSMPFEALSTHRNTFVNNVAALARKRSGVNMRAACDIVRSPTYVPRLVDHLMWLLENVKDIPAGTYHIASQGQASLYEVADFVCKAVRSVVGVDPVRRAELHPKDDYARAPKFTALNCDRWAEICPLPLPTWQDGLAECCGYVSPLRAAG